MIFVGRGSRLLSEIQCKKAGWGCWFLLFMTWGCADSGHEESFQVFSRLSAESTGITFENRIVEHEGFNVLEYEYFFNGGGVAIGDLNNDGLPDVYFTANMEPDQLYLNKGELTFENITAAVNLDDAPRWTTGVTMADVNADGWLDIYVCQSGQVSEDRRRNLLYINNGDLTFSEQAAAFGLDDPSYSNHASFFDYDRDGDLDMYLLNHPIRRFSNFDVALMRQQRDPLAGDKLYRNDNGFFVDVSAEAGIIGNPLGFGLSAVVSDINLDGWPDLYVANDYIEEDYLYINQQNGTFVNEIAKRLTHASYSSMGTDIADINNDGLPDVLTLDMMAEDHYRQKILKGPENYIFYDQMRERGIHEQYMRNMLQLNNGNETFSEIGQLAGVSNTDWSWAVLLADFDNNSFKDVVITNGYLRDYTDIDYLERVLGEARRASAMGETFSSLDLVQKMPSTKLQNYAFMNEGGLVFSDKQQRFDIPSFSNGAAYGDLDLDGDLDLVINNINDAAFLFQNNTEKRANSNYLRIVLTGAEGNPLGIGSTIKIKGTGDSQFLHYVSPARGYLSSVDPVVSAGLGALTSVDLHVTWPDGNEEVRRQVATNQTVSFAYADSRAASEQQTDADDQHMYQLADDLGMAFVHQENRFYDFSREPLLPHMLSRMGPALAIEDVNRDNLEDVFIGGARGQAAVLYLQQPNGSFKETAMPDFGKHAYYEDVDALFFDADNDGDVDLYVASGGNDEVEDMALYQDRLYLNNGFGAFSHASAQLPVMESSTATVSAHDFDLDGDLDLFVGGLTLPGRYPLAPRSYVLENQEGEFQDVTATKAEPLMAPGMVTDATWSDLDGDDVAELLLTGEWMGLRVYSYEPVAGFTERTDAFGLAETQG
ncbi:MAG: VCBS repeat-containing protein, partial [Rhodothermales bacterium]